MRPREKEATDQFIAACRIESLTLSIAQKAGEYRASYKAKGKILSIVDCLIATTAKMNNHLVATKNIKDFPEKEYLLAW
jgi:predicted nucleic acid-binding protein